MQIRSLLYILFVSAFSCTSGTSGNSATDSSHVHTDSPGNTATVATIPDTGTGQHAIPDTGDIYHTIVNRIDGCGCFFSASQEAHAKERYFFVEGYDDSTGYIILNDTLQQLKLLSTGRKPNDFGDYDHTDIYHNNSIKVTVDIRYKGPGGEESWGGEGTITIEDKNGTKTVKKFVGDCGC